MRNSREPLNCTLEQLAYILTHYQVMAPFLEHIFTFKRRSEAHLHAAFRSEDYLWDQGSTFSTTSDIVDGDLRIQHCFNLVGLEYEFDQFNFRQAAVYYKLDMSSGKAVWILIKGNKVIREIIEESTQNRVTLDQLSTPLEVFLLGLKIHLLIYEWATQNWMPYIDSLQQKYDESSKAVRNTPIGEKTDDKKLDKIIASKSWNFGLHQRKSWSEKLTSGLSLSKRRTGQVTSGAKSADPIQSPHLDISQIFSIDKLQSLHRQTTDVQEAILVLDQNKAVLHDMVNRFHYLRESEELRQQMGIEESDPFQGFFRTCQQYIRDLESQRGRLGAIMADLERVTSSVSVIIKANEVKYVSNYSFY